MKTVYGIMVDYHMWSEEKGEYDQPMLLGLDYPPVNVFIFEDNLTEKTKVFVTNEEASKYIVEKIADPDAICYCNPRVVRLQVTAIGGN